jgi:Nuclear transport factor 2 (NTF2) domain
LTFNSEKFRGIEPILKKLASLPSASQPFVAKMDTHPAGSGFLVLIYGTLTFQTKAYMTMTFLVHQDDSSQYYMGNSIIRMGTHVNDIWQKK